MSVREFAVLGAGVMGSGIALEAAQQNIPTQLIDLSEEALARASSNIERQLQRQLKRCAISDSDYQQTHSALRIQSAQSFDKIDLLVEAVVEDAQIKLSALQGAEQQLPADAILTTNTSTISIDLLAHALQRPKQFCGLHFFNPVAQMRLVEVVKGEATSTETLQSCVAFAKTLDKQPVVVKDCPGFLVNRILFPYFHGFDQLLKEGVSFER
ncbi:MAG: fatty acid oxidation complex subunit alpha FadB, partial [Oceanospirillaceae bacterium]|nr:fatty acid oxidation complex subunit alpha FadB [Oceanospirillaceae bacterium]